MLVAIHPSELSNGLAEAMLLAGAETTPLPEQPVAGEWAVAVFEVGSEPAATLRRARGLAEDLGIDVLLVVDRSQAGVLADADFAADFLMKPADPVELRVRLTRLSGSEPAGEVVRFKDLELNTATYQATVNGRPVDLTYMEYELLHFFTENQGRVWSREQLLSKVWGYDYFGGARTVDVHVRRLRSKLGEERASWITTVRSVGYRFG
jgi:DNA-binding response OmpR family regulator